MAKRKSKIQPAVMKLNFEQRLIGSSTYNFLDLSQVASLVNRRFYRQGLNWGVAGIKVQQTASTAVGPSPGFPMITISKLPNTWVMSNAWEKGFRHWKKQQDEALSGSESAKATYNDFKVFMNERHHTEGFAANILPVDSEGNPTAVGEWEPSQIVIPNFVTVGTNYEPYIQCVGDDVGGAGGTFSLIKAYEDSRAVPQSPDPAINPGVDSADNIYRAMFDVGDNMEDVLENAIQTNNDLPYPQENYPGGDTQTPGLEIHERAIVSDTIVGNTSYFSGGNFPCGLIQFHFDNYLANTESPITVYIELTLVPGKHRGYLAESMTEM